MIQTGSFLDSIFQRLAVVFNPVALGRLVANGLANLIVAAAILLAFLGGWWLLRVAIDAGLRRSRVDATTASFVLTIVKFVVLVIGTITALDAIGVQTSAALASLGIAGLTIGFAARDALSNLISGILIYLDRPFVIGDLVEIEGMYGKVSRISLRSTRIVTPDGRMLAVPNTQVITKPVASYTNFPHVRLDIAITVDVTEDLDNVRRVLLAQVQDDPDYMDNPEPRVVVAKLNDYNVQVELQAWLDDELKHVAARYALRERAFKALTAAGVRMPFETIQLAPADVTLHQG